MGKKEVPLHALAAYLPEGALTPVLHYLSVYKIHLTITKARNTILGDYRHSLGDSHHRISVNGNLNKYAFLITLLHELAHLVTFDQYRNRVAPHGKEWKLNYSKLLVDFIRLEIFPEDIKYALKTSINNPAASSCADETLMRVLRKYDVGNQHYILIEQVLEGALFLLKDGRVFRRGEKLRKRYKGVDVKTGQTYLFNALYEVFLYEQ
jgi:SprT protein